MVVLRPAAVDDIEAAERWYEDNAAGLGERFLAAVDRTLDLVADQPGNYRVVDEPIRRAVVQRFPYSVFFVAEEERIVVLAVFHQAMDPRRLVDRRQ